MAEGVKIVAGRSAPLVRFTVEADPPSIYVVMRLKDGAEAEVMRRASVARGLTPAPIACMEREEPAHYLTLNVYRVSGITNALRAEWSAYVDAGDGVPRYCVVEARSSTRSMDPVDIITPSSELAHDRSGLSVTTVLNDAELGRFSCTLALPDDVDDRARDRSAPEWTSANDLIYWANGVADRTFYDAGLADADQVRLGPESIEIDDTTRWADLVEPDPAHVLVFRRPIEFVVSPWYTLG